MFGTVTTKLGGLRHVYEYTFHYHHMPLEEALEKIDIRKPFQNATCMHCHSTRDSDRGTRSRSTRACSTRLRDGTRELRERGLPRPGAPVQQAGGGRRSR